MIKYTDYKRTAIDVNLTFKKYTVDGKETCSSWAGDDVNPKESCFFLGTKRFGTEHVCMYIGQQSIDFHEGTSLTKPTVNCPLRRI